MQRQSYLGSWTGTDLVSTPTVRAATSTPFFWARLVRFAGCQRIATRLSLGRSSLSSSKRFPPRSVEIWLSPVTLPPGTRHARHQPDLCRSVNVHKDDWHLRRRTPGRKRCRRPGSQNDVDVESQKFCG